MKVSCLQENLAKGLSIVSRAVSTRSTLPVLANVLMATDNGRLKLSATNLEVVITCWIRAKVEEEGGITVPARTLNDLVGQLAQEQVYMALDEPTQTLHVTCAKADSNIKGIDAQEFPLIPEPDRENRTRVEADVFKQMINQVAFAAAVEQVWAKLQDSPTRLTDKEIKRAKSFFTEPDYAQLDDTAEMAEINSLRSKDTHFNHWLSHNVHNHRVPGYRAITLALKPTGVAPGDITDGQLEAIADLADQHSFGEIRTTHLQNMVLGDVRANALYDIWQKLKQHGFATPNVGTLTDMICCPGGDFCSLANAKSIPVAEAIQREFEDLDYLYDLGPIDLNISGCMNACGHHHVGHIGILGVDKKGEEFYQIQLGGNAKNDAALGKVLGPAFSRADVVGAVKNLLDVYIEQRQTEETFLDAYNRLGLTPFKERVYAKAN